MLMTSTVHPLLELSRSGVSSTASVFSHTFLVLLHTIHSRTGWWSGAWGDKVLKPSCLKTGSAPVRIGGWIWWNRGVWSSTQQKLVGNFTSRDDLGLGLSKLQRESVISMHINNLNKQFDYQLFHRNCSIWKRSYRKSTSLESLRLATYKMPSGNPE